MRPTFLLALALLLGIAAPAPARPLRLVALGDSLTAGYLLPADAAFPAQLQRALQARGFDVEIANAGVSGDTSSGALERLDWALGGECDGVLVEIGANDMLRGTDPALTRQNIEAILARLRSRNIPAFLAGMRAAPNLGPEYAAKFDAIYPDLAKKYDAAFYPFFLDGVAGRPERQLPDGMHPNREGVAIIVAGILPEVTAWLERVQKK
ncbi:arylesterase [uncultured Rhodoblastus sp.]|uniref:arylesterase n=1 Tax=uncultured Rhodoblastus sp. TaxID=543037 RepID=UPI0025DE8EC5|nr:arylesterase [uncultured Rhodoblastus sp.]